MHSKLIYITHFSTLLALTLVLQMGGFPQPITGPLVNMMLYLTALHLGMIGGISLGIITPLVALWRGQLPAILAPMMPFIIAGNAVLVIIFKLTLTKLKMMLQSEEGWQMGTRIGISIILSATIKFFVMFIGISLVVPHILGIQLPEKIAGMMATPQFFTAIIGGILAFLIAHLLWRAGIFKRTLN